MAGRSAVRARSQRGWNAGQGVGPDVAGHDAESDIDTDAAQGSDSGRKEVSPEAKAKAIVLRQLAVSPKSRYQLSVKLAEREVPVESARIVLDRFEEVRLIDDAEFAQVWVRSRARNKSLARGVLRRELAEKGIAEELAEAALEQLSEADERSSAAELVRRKLRSVRPVRGSEELNKHRRRLVSMLLRKGYSSGLAFNVVNRELGEIEVDSNALDTL